MTNEEAKVFLDNLKICINEHPIVADWLVEIADRKTEPTSSKMEQVEDEPHIVGKHADVIIIDEPWYKEEPKDEPQTETKTETQNSNLTFKTLEYCDICDHKGCEECIANALDEHCIPSQFKKQIEDECAKEYEELGLKELKELIEADRKDESLTEGVWNAGYKTGYDKGYKDAQKVKDSQDLVKAFCEDGTWLERQGVYTLTLAEAKQRAVDIIESVLATDEPQTDEFIEPNYYDPTLWE